MDEENTVEESPEDRVVIENREMAEATRGEDNLLTRLRQRREEIGGDRLLDLDVPGYNGDLVIRYKSRGDMWDQFKKLGQKVERSKNPRRELQAHIDTLLLACEQVMVRKDGELHPLGQAFPDVVADPEEPVSLSDTRLAEALGFEADTARKNVLCLFNNPLAITAQHNDVAAWLADASKDADNEFLGE